MPPVGGVLGYSGVFWGVSGFSSESRPAWRVAKKTGVANRFAPDSGKNEGFRRQFPPSADGSPRPSISFGDGTSPRPGKQLLPAEASTNKLWCLRCLVG